MNLESQEAGRSAQRRRTKAALVEAAIAALRRGERPSVGEAAKAADISRRTAYRYFPSQDVLLSEAALQAIVPTVAEQIGNVDVPVRERLERMVRATMAGAYANEFALRTLMRTSTDAPADAKRPFRGGRRVELIEHALQPLANELAPAAYRQLVNALCVSIGAEALIVLRDICGLDQRAATDACVWSALSLLDAATTEGPVNRRNAP